LFSIDRPGQHSGDAVNRLFVVIVALRWSHQPLGARYKELKGCNRTGRVVTSDLEADSERPEANDLIGRIDAEVDGLLGHMFLVGS
jgi:hypothetical protein